MRKTRVLTTGIAVVGLVAALLWVARSATTQGLRDLRQKALAEPFVGVTTDGTPMKDLFPIRATGVTTGPVKLAADAFLDSLDDAQRAAVTFPVDDIEWRKWDNVHRAQREGVSFREMTEPQKTKAFGLLAASLSARGLEKSRNVMRLNEHLAHLMDKHDEYGEELYFLTVMGTPSETEPWGWQLDGHHLDINYFILGDQVVMTPAFMGSEPVIAETEPYKGTAVLQDEQNRGLALMMALDDGQRAKAKLAVQKTRGNALAQAYNDNLVLDYAGLSASELTARQRELLLALIVEYVGNMDEGHAKVKMEEVEAHLDATRFAWIGDVGLEAVFYYRVQSPVVLIEFDHQGPVALDGPPVASRRHVHSVVRTPNGNDYGKDLLREHYEDHAHDTSHGHVP